MSMIDYRRTDVRDNIRPNPFWIRSQKMEFGGKLGFNSVMDDNESVFMDFPLEDKGAFPVIIMGVLIEILTAFDGTPSMSIGDGTIASYLDSDGATVTPVGATSIAATGVVLPAAAGNKLVYPLAAPFVLIPANTTTPVLYAALTAIGAVTQGAVRINILASEAN